MLLRKWHFRWCIKVTGRQWHNFSLCGYYYYSKAQNTAWKVSPSLHNADIWCRGHFEQSPSLKILNATFFLGHPVCKRIFLFLYLIFLLNITIALSLYGCMFQYFFSGSFISLQMTFTARAAPSCIAWSEAFQRHSRPPLTPFLSFKTALAPTTRCTRKRTEKVHPPENPKIGTDPFFPFTLLPESLNHTGHRSWFALKATISWNTLKFLYLSHWTPVRLLNCLGQAYIQCFAPFLGILTKKIPSLAVSIDQKVTKRLLRKCVIQERTIWDDKESSPLPQPPSLCWTPFHRNNFTLILYFPIVKTTLVIKWTRAALNEADSNGGTKLLILLADAKMQNCRILMNPFPVYSAITF